MCQDKYMDDWMIPAYQQILEYTLCYFASLLDRRYQIDNHCKVFHKDHLVNESNCYEYDSLVSKIPSYKSGQLHEASL